MIKGQTFIKLQGRIVSIYRQNMQTIVRIFVNTYQENKPEVVLFGDLRKIANGFTKGDFVYVEGEFALTSEIDVTGKKHYYQIIKAKKIEKAKTGLSKFFNMPCGSICDYVNEIYIAGIVDGRLEKNKVTSLFIKTNVHSKHLIRVSSFSNIAAQEGQFVILKGVIQTKTKDMPDGSKYTFQNIIVLDFDIIEDKQESVLDIEISSDFTENILPEEYNKEPETIEADIFSALGENEL